VPISRDLLDASPATGEERAWWNAYHAKVLAIVGPQVEGAVLAWLEAQCAPL
jgi:Xaa-Pro aminopeptidase